MKDHLWRIFVDLTKFCPDLEQLTGYRARSRIRDEYLGCGVLVLLTLAAGRGSWEVWMMGYLVGQNWVASGKPLVTKTADHRPSHGFDYLRLLDLIGLVFAVALLFPLMMAIGLAIYAADRGPVFFGHVRVGRMGRTFRCWKFRTMVVNSEQVLDDHLAQDAGARAEWETNHKLKKDPRITPIGRLLRQSSLDELPQLWNVLVGEMSLVGPRPIIVKEIVRYKSHFGDYCSCRPGITGLWQISGRNDTSYLQRVALDVKFARSKSVWLYIYIIAATIPAVLHRRGAY